MLGMVQEMLWEWQGLDGFMLDFGGEARSLREGLHAELASR